MNSQETSRRILDLSVKFVEILRSRFDERLTSVCLFGSAVRGTLRRGSDIDFLIIIRNLNKSYHKRVKDMVPLLDRLRETEEYLQVESLGFSLEPCFLLLTMEETNDHPAILVDISQEGLILYDRSDFLKGHLDRVRETLGKLGAIKKITPQGHYWVLKPGLKPGEVIEI